MKIIVLVKQVPDTEEERKLDLVSGVLDRGASASIIDEVNERALEVALLYKDSNKGTEVVALSMGPESVVQSLRKALSMGADSAMHVRDDALAGSDASRTAAVLAAALRNTRFDLVVAGNESTDGRGGVIPAMIAEHLSLPHLTFLNSTEISDAGVSGVRASEDGTLSVHAALPAVISVTERVAEARFPNYKGIMTAKKKPLEVISLSQLGFDPAFARMSSSRVVFTSERATRTAGKTIVDEGTAGVQLAEYLAAGYLI